MTRKRRSIRRELARWTIPPGFQDLIREAIRERRDAEPRLDPKLRAEFARNARFHDIHKGERCFVLATGPSIKQQDLRPLANEHCISVNMFFHHEHIQEIAPRYHVVAPNHAPFKFEAVEKMIAGIHARPWTMEGLFFGYTHYPYTAWRYFAQHPEYADYPIHYLDYAGAPPIDEDNYNDPAIWNLCGRLFRVRSAVFCALQLAWYMGFTRAYLLGTDYNYLEQVDHGQSTHFFPDGKALSDAAFWREREEMFLAYHYAWKRYRFIRTRFEEDGRRIYNATEGGMLDVFPRVALSDALRQEPTP